MRRLFVVLAKLVGLLQLYWSLINLMQIGFTLSMVGRADASEFGRVLVSLLGIVVYFALCLVMVWVLLARTEWLADKLRVVDGAEMERLDGLPVLLVGVKLIGVYMTVHAIPSLARALLDASRIWQGQAGLHPWNKTIPAVLQLGLGLFLAMKSARVVAWLPEGENGSEQPPA